MKIGLISDIHNNVKNLAAALKHLDHEAIGAVICCGDLIDAEIVPLFNGLEVHIVEGNVDADPASAAREVARLGNSSTFGGEYTATIDGKRLIALHGHVADRLQAAIRSGLYDYVFHGHSHRRRDERIGSTRVINPGALGGKREQTRSLAILDLASDRLRIIELEE